MEHQICNRRNCSKTPSFWQSTGDHFRAHNLVNAVAREALSLLDKSCDFCKKHPNEVVRLPIKVIHELKNIRSILPFLRVSVCADWRSEVHASDASLQGIGVCARAADVNQVSKMGRLSDR